ncbi:hypothetical protein HPB51_025722 [Rhipicephalus microplus]|uniref:Uncharacterized protein n=1 Tax=Rhipicephalus microplus TaxID=6941 RepID=A0A9J6DE81_RHIMP|nr:hypothetical protein HPB51_025722 [Rhipicephalus microplus]
MAQPLMQGLQVTAAGRDLGELHLRIQPTNNTFMVATCHERTTLHLVQLKELVLRKTSYPVATYRTPPPAAVRGFLSQAYWMGSTLSIFITFAHGPVPHTIHYISVVYRCTQYKGSPDACTNCRRAGYSYDVCPHPKSGLCSRCGDKHDRQDVPSCISSCILCGGQHLTGTGSCKSSGAGAGGMTSPDTELQALREEVKQLRAAFSTSTPTLPPVSLPQSFPTPSHQPPQKKGGLMRAQPNP